ncbi:MAG: ABC transporter permease [Actinomycetaceae bacterium]|nr:ABC transporter permease [Actinomycetaceae bacterium]
MSIALPIFALLARADLQDVIAALSTPGALSALRLSFVTASISTVLCVLVGVPLAIFLTEYSGLLSQVVRALVNLPLVMPPLVGGLALLLLLGRTGVLGGYFAELGISIPFTTPAVVIAQVFVALPFMVISVEGTLRAQSRGFRDVASSLGASPTQTLMRITLPLARSGVFAGIVLTFARAVGEFGATALFAGNREGVTQTMPLVIYTAFNGGGANVKTAISLALLLLFTAFAVMIFTKSWYPQR